MKRKWEPGLEPCPGLTNKPRFAATERTECAELKHLGREPQVASGTRRQAPVVVSKKPVSSATHHKKMNSAYNLSELGNSFSLV